ncbi:TetR/AcrR family transcriptional regulator [Thalassobacillus hwangdonensis]|uniref:TetR/AcrR family transcriptional regulator n=1 Tax=Thalassobacillus hwangdonensis TaxID=546108 RepID=A0ABW3L6P1_9BACI
MDEKQYLQQLIEAAEKEPDLTPKQAKILEAAIEIFSEKGYAATSTSEIAKRAEVAEGTIFRHYKTKKDLLLSIVMPMITKVAMPFFATHFINQVFAEAPSDYKDLLRKIMRNRYEFAKKNVPMLKILLQEAAFHNEIHTAFKGVFMEKAYPRFKELIHKNQEEGILVDFPVHTIIRMTMTTIFGFLITRFIIMPDADWDDEAEMERTIEFMLHGLSTESSNK